MSTTVAEQEAVAARKKSNLAFTFMSLEPKRREAMAVFYDFCRIVDDIADEPSKPDSEKSTELQAWKDAIRACYIGETVPSFAQPLKEVITEFSIDEEPLQEIVAGVAMDIGTTRYETFADLQQYCYRVASAVGLVCIQIFGCKHPVTPLYAETLGYALQFTNILRDVVEDIVTMGRVYLPQAELRAFGIQEKDLRNPSSNPQCQKLFKLCYYRCKHFFNKARRLLPKNERENLKAALVMGAFYEDILEKIKESGFDIREERTRLSKPRKLQLLWKTLRESKKDYPAYHQPGTVAVMGGGIAGITTAIQLGLEGFTPSIYEAKTYVGGRAHSLTDATTGLVLDNGQHIVMGCYKHFLQLVETLGIEDKFDKQETMEVPYLSPGQRWSELKAEKLPAPLHLLVGLFNFNELKMHDLLSIIKLGTALKLLPAPPAEETVESWLKRNHQSKGAIRALWEPFCIAALNEPITTASAQLLYNTLQQSLFGKSEDATILLSNVGLSELFEPEVELFLSSIGGSLNKQTQIKEFCFENNRIESLTTSKGKQIQADTYVSALNWGALKNLLPEGDQLKHQIQGIQSSSILSIHILCDKKLFDSPTNFIGLLDSPIHWIFDRSEQLTQEYQGKYLYAVIVSAAEDWMAPKSAVILEKLKSEIDRYFPDVSDLQIDYHLVYKSKDATFAAKPNIEQYRPESTTNWENLFLAGDWINTRLPATLESASMSSQLVLDAMEAKVS